MQSPSPSFPGYDSVAFHARGGSAVVWKARQISLDREVAIKQLLPELCGDSDDLERFLAEARALAKMSHPNIVRCIDAFHRDGRFCFVMEFVDGGTISEYVHEQGRFTERESLAVASAVAASLSYAWNRHGIAHCDIKPANIMFTSGGAFKITDFGISQSLMRIRAPNAAGEIDIFGTPHYMSPEQVSGSQTLGPQSDMYALGATLYYCVAGCKLFHDLGDDEAMQAQVSWQCPDLADFIPELSHPFCAFVERLLAKNPADRHGSWEEVAAEIATVAAGRFGASAEFSAPSTILRGAARAPANQSGIKNWFRRMRG